MCLNSSGLQSPDNIKFGSDSVDVFLDTCVTYWATPFKNDFLPNTFVPIIENMEGSGGGLKVHGFGYIPYHVQIYYGSKVIIKFNNQPFVPNLKFRLLAQQQIATYEKNNGLPEN